MEHITLQEYKQLQQKGNSKYKAKKTSIVKKKVLEDKFNLKIKEV